MRIFRLIIKSYSLPSLCSTVEWLIADTRATIVWAVHGVIRPRPIMVYVTDRTTVRQCKLRLERRLSTELHLLLFVAADCTPTLSSSRHETIGRNLHGKRSPAIAKSDRPYRLYTKASVRLPVAEKKRFQSHTRYGEADIWNATTNVRIRYGNSTHVGDGCR